MDRSQHITKGTKFLLLPGTKDDQLSRGVNSDHIVSFDWRDPITYDSRGQRISRELVLQMVAGPPIVIHGEWADRVWNHLSQGAERFGGV